MLTDSDVELSYPDVLTIEQYCTVFIIYTCVRFLWLKQECNRRLSAEVGSWTLIPLTRFTVHRFAIFTAVHFR